MKKINTDQKINTRPYVIHADPTGTYPTHTHGGNKVGMPEFMIDPRAFGGYGNAVHINAAFDYFNHPNGKKMLNRILQGETIEISKYELIEDPPVMNPLPICFRRVSIDFEGVKLAYPYIDGIDPEFGIIQLWVYGDDFALTDRYYEGGVTW